MSDASLRAEALACVSESEGRPAGLRVVLVVPWTRRAEASAFGALLGGASGGQDKRRLLALSVRPSGDPPGRGWAAHCYTLKRPGGADAAASPVGRLVVSERRNVRRLSRLEGGAAGEDGRQRGCGLLWAGPRHAPGLPAARDDVALDTPEDRAALLGTLWWLRLQASAAVVSHVLLGTHQV